MLKPALVQSSIVCTDEDCNMEEGPETPASAEKHACVIIRYAHSKNMVQHCHKLLETNTLSVLTAGPVSPIYISPLSLFSPFSPFTVRTMAMRL